MKYTCHTNIDDIRPKYDHIIAWGGGALLSLNYWPEIVQAEFIVDGSGKNAGKIFRGTEVRAPKELETVEGKCLVVIYTIYEKQVLEQIQQCEWDVDTVIFPLLRIGMEHCTSYAKNGEDVMLGILLRYLDIRELSYLEIGVCHPVMRNNTFLLREHIERLGGTCVGVLVEANPLWWNLIEEYRPKDQLLKCGVGDMEETKKLYIFPDLLGHTTFLKSQADEKKCSGIEYREEPVKVRRINDILKMSFDRVPDLLALDAEGMDFTILNTWDHELYPIGIVVAELDADEGGKILSLMDEKGYALYARTMENGIWIRKDEMSNKLLPQM